MTQRKCRVCGEITDIPCTDEQLLAWRSGQLIQDAMPNISIDERELLISGTCGKCFDKMFRENEV